MKSLLTLLLFSILFTGVFANQTFAQETEQLPAPPPIPQPIPEPEPIPQPEPKPIAKDVDFTKLVELTKGFSGADITAIANRAAITALKRYVSGKLKNIKEIEISQQDLIDSIKKVRPVHIRTEEPLTQTIK